MNWLLKTERDYGILILRLTLGAVFFAHGAQKALGWFGGYGLSGTIASFTQEMGLPLAVAALVIAAEFLGSLGLIVGFLTRIAALGIACVMAGAITMVHLPNGFFMNWSGAQPGEGFEYHLLVLGMTLALMIRGGGALSIDRMLSRRKR